MTHEDIAKEAMFEGVDARRDGLLFKDCPHPHGTREGNQRLFQARLDAALGGAG